MSASQATNTEINNNNPLSSLSVSKAKLDKNKQKTLRLKYFLQGLTVDNLKKFSSESDLSIFDWTNLHACSHPNN